MSTISITVYHCVYLMLMQIFLFLITNVEDCTGLEVCALSLSAFICNTKLHYDLL